MNLILKRDFNLTRLYLKIHPRYQFSSKFDTDEEVSFITIGHQGKMALTDAKKLMETERSAWHLSSNNELRLFNIEETDGLLEIVMNN